MRQRTLRVLSLALCGLLAVAATATAADDLWLHVRVDEAHGAKVSVNLPLSMVEKALPMIPAAHMHQHGHLEFDDWQVTAAELRELWNDIKSSPDMAFVTVEDQGEHVKVWKQGDYLRATVDGRHGGEQVEVRVPLAVVDALLSSDGEEMNFQAAIAALVDHGEGELVTVSDNQDRVRVWVDRIAEAE